MTPSESRVVTELIRNDGNAKKVSQILGASESYVHRIKKTYWQPGMEDIPTQVVPSPEQLLTEIIPPNVKAVKDLRDETLALLADRVSSGLIDSDEATRLLTVLMKYEHNLKSVLSPAISVMNDNRQIHINNLVDALQNTDPQTLKLLAGFEEGEIIDE